MDFVGDITAILRERLVTLGYLLSPELSDEAVRMRYFNLQHRLIPQRPRNVHRANSSTCPPNLHAGLTFVEGKIIRGEALRPHLSCGILDVSYSDSLLNDWGVYHFHLGTTLRDDGFIVRTGPVLFARMTENDAYLIDVREHGAWSSQDLL